jgi:hypothetical protein
MQAYYGFGDASGYGFGATIQIGEDLWFEYGHTTNERGTPRACEVYETFTHLGPEVGH